MTIRPYFHYSGEQLLALFEANQDNPQVLNDLRAELGFRSTPKMLKLLEIVRVRLADSDIANRGLFDELDRVEEATRETEATARQQEKARREQEVNRDVAVGEQQNAERALVARRGAKRLHRLLMPSEARLIQRVQAASLRSVELSLKLAQVSSVFEDLKTQWKAHRTQVEGLRRELAGQDREALRAEQAAMASGLVGLENELATIRCATG